MTTGRLKVKLAKFVKLDSTDKWLLVRAVGWLAVARLRLVLTPFRTLVTRLAADQGGSEPDPDLVNRVGLAVSRAAANVPWRSDCFPQAIAARSMLNRCGYASTVHLGVDRIGANDLLGHAWLTCGDIVVTGGADLDRFTEVHRL